MFTVGIPGADGTLKSNWTFVKVCTDEGLTGLGEEGPRPRAAGRGLRSF